jgi:phosphatidylserine decarboxylase
VPAQRQPLPPPTGPGPRRSSATAIDRLLNGISQQAHINFLLTNRIPRALATQVVGRLARVRQPVVRALLMAVWQRFAGDLCLHEARTTTFATLQDCFVRELKPGARPIDPDPDVLVSPCDAIVGACGRVRGTEVIQAKGFPYTLHDLLGDERLVAACRDGHYVTLRLTSSMYHRFHAPADCEVDEVVYISGDTFNVNPIAIQRIERLFCRNERAVVQAGLRGGGESIVLVPVAAILVASMRFTWLDVALNLKYRGPNRIPGRATFQKGDEMGHFRLGSTIILFAPPQLTLCQGVHEGRRIRMGEPLLRRHVLHRSRVEPVADTHYRSDLTSV